MNVEFTQACVNCHFLMQQGNGHKFEVTLQDRESIRKKDYSSFDNVSLGCYFGVWDEGHNFARERRHEVMVATNRKDFCFYWSYRPGMFFPAAEVLQKREADNRESSRDRLLTIIGLWIAAIALAVGVVIEFAKAFGWIK